MTGNLDWWRHIHDIAVTRLQTLTEQHSNWRSNHYGQRTDEIAQTERWIADLEAEIARLEARETKPDLWDAS